MKCLRCGETINSPAYDVEVPQPGDFLICNHCGYLMVFSSRGTLRELTAEETRMVAHAPTDEELKKIRQIILDAKDRSEELESIDEQFEELVRVMEGFGEKE